MVPFFSFLQEELERVIARCGDKSFQFENSDDPRKCNPLMQDAVFANYTRLQFVLDQGNPPTRKLLLHVPQGF
jgi:hypothetical protein